MQSKIEKLNKMLSRGQVLEALSYAKRLTIENPNHGILNAIAGNCYQSLGKSSEAIKYYLKAIKLGPPNQEIYFRLGNIYSSNKEPQKAISCYKSAIVLEPNFAHAIYFLAYTQWQTGLINESIDNYRRVIAIKPDFPEAHCNLGFIYLQAGEYLSASRNLKLAIKYKPNYAQAHNSLGSVYNATNRPEEAISCYEEALAIDSNFIAALNNLGSIHNEMGNTQKSILYYKKAISIAPEYVNAHVNLSALKNYTSLDSQLEKMRELFSSTQTQPIDRIKLAFAIAKAFDDLNGLATSFQYLKIGNQLRKKQLNYAHDDDRNLFQHIDDYFTLFKPSFEGLPPKSNTHSYNLIFIVGMPRSGTSLIEQILSSHSNVYGAGELNILEHYLTPKVASKDYFDNLGNNELLDLRNKYLAHIEGLNRKEEFVIDKMPLNFRWIGFILRVFPDARIINIERSPIATCWSNYKLNFLNEGIGFAYDLKDLVKYYNLYKNLMCLWESIFPQKIHYVSYESLTRNPNYEIKNMLSYCNLTFESSCENFHKTKRQIKTASSTQVRKKIYTGSSLNWKKFSTFLEPLIDGLDE